MKTKKSPIPRQSYVQKINNFCDDRKLTIVSKLSYAHLSHTFRCHNGHTFERTPKVLLRHLSDIPCPFCRDNTPHNKKYSDDYILETIISISNKLGYIPSPSELKEINIGSFNGGSVYVKLAGEYEKNIVPLVKQETNLEYDSKYFFIDGTRYKSKIEVYFANFFKRHSITFEYEPTKFNFDGFSKVPDFKVGQYYYDIAGYHSKKYDDKLESAIKSFESKNIPYKVIRVDIKDLFNFDFYIQLCCEYSITPIFNGWLDVYKNLMVWNKSQYDNDLYELKTLLSTIYDYTYKSNQYRQINFLIKRLGLKNIKTACEYLKVQFDGRRHVTHGKGKVFGTPQCVTDGTLKKFLEENQFFSIREIERLNLFDISRKTMSKYKKEWSL